MFNTQSFYYFFKEKLDVNIVQFVFFLYILYKIEGRQGKGDDTALNAIRLKCRQGHNSPNTGGTIWAHEGRWGQWSSTMNCPSGKRFVGFRLQVEDRQVNENNVKSVYSNV